MSLSFSSDDGGSASNHALGMNWRVYPACSRYSSARAGLFALRRMRHFDSILLNQSGLGTGSPNIVRPDRAGEISDGARHSGTRVPSDNS